LRPARNIRKRMFAKMSQTKLFQKSYITGLKMRESGLIVGSIVFWKKKLSCQAYEKTAFCHHTRAAIIA